MEQEALEVAELLVSLLLPPVMAAAMDCRRSPASLVGFGLPPKPWMVALAVGRAAPRLCERQAILPACDLPETCEASRRWGSVRWVIRQAAQAARWWVQAGSVLAPTLPDLTRPALQACSACRGYWTRRLRSSAARLGS